MVSAGRFRLSFGRNDCFPAGKIMDHRSVRHTNSIAKDRACVAPCVLFIPTKVRLLDWLYPFRPFQDFRIAVLLYSLQSSKSALETGNLLHLKYNL